MEIILSFVHIVLDILLELGHKDTRTIPHYRRLRNEALAEDTKAVRDEMNELLAQYRREKENAETR